MFSVRVWVASPTQTYSRNAGKELAHPSSVADSPRVVHKVGTQERLAFLTCRRPYFLPILNSSPNVNTPRQTMLLRLNIENNEIVYSVAKPPNIRRNLSESDNEARLLHDFKGEWTDRAKAKRAS